MDRVKNEIIINRASEFKTQHEEIDNNVLQKIEIESTDPNVFTALKQLWVEDYETEEEKSLAIWNKKEKGLREVYDKEIRDKIDGLTTKQDEQEDSPTPIPQQRAQTNESGQNQRGRSPNNRNSSPTQPQYRSPQRNHFQDQRNCQNQINGYNTFGPAGRGPSPQRSNGSFQGQHFSSNNGFTPRPPRRQGGNPSGPYRNRYNNRRYNNRGYRKNNYRRNNFNNFNGHRNNNFSSFNGYRNNNFNGYRNTNFNNFDGYRNSNFRGCRDNNFNNFNEHNIQGGFNSNQSNGNFINKELHMEYQNDHNIPRQPNIEPRRTNEERQRVGETPT